MRYDKKFVSGKNKFILPVAIGKVKVVTGVDEKIIRQVIQKRMM
jgi:3-dehydroquinate synthetase